VSRARVRSVDGVPRARAQRTPPPQPTVAQLMDQPKPATPYYGRTLPDEGIGRIPCIGLDSGAIPQTRPDTSPINQR
jgi:hypothetical protein